MGIYSSGNPERELKKIEGVIKNIQFGVLGDGGIYNSFKDVLSFGLENYSGKFRLESLVISEPPQIYFKNGQEINMYVESKSGEVTFLAGVEILDSSGKVFYWRCAREYEQRD